MTDKIDTWPGREKHSRLRTELEAVLGREHVEPESRRAVWALFEKLASGENATGQARCEHEHVSIVDAIPVPLFLHDRQFRIVLANHAYAARAGMAVADTIGKPYWQVFPVMEGPRPGCAHAMAGQQHHTEEWRLPSGEVFLIGHYPILDDKGQFLYALHCMQDITERKQSAKLIQEGAQRLRLATEASEIGIWEWNTQTNRIRWDAQMFHIYGMAETENGWVDYSDWRGAVLPEELPQQEALLRDTVDRLGHGSREFRIRRRSDGEVRTIQAVETVRPNAQGHAEWLVGTNRDITQSRQAERQLRLFRDLLDKSNDAIEVIDPLTQRFVDVNEAMCRSLGYSRAELLSMGIADIDPTFGPADMKLLEERLQKTGSALFERTHRRKDGSIFPVEVSVSAVELDKSYGIGIVRDITERKRTEQSLQHANRALRTLSACNGIVMHASEEGELLTDMCRNIIKKGGYRFAWIGFVESAETPNVRPVAHAGFEDGYLDGFKSTGPGGGQGRHPAGRAVRLGVRQVVQDISKDPDFPWPDQARKCGYAACIALPLRQKGSAALGVLAIYAGEPGAFDETEVKLLAELADELTFGIYARRVRQERDHYQQEHLRSAERIKDGLMGTISAIARTLEKRDPYTAGHQNRVSELATAIAREYGLDGERIEGLRLGAMIHDIGKIYVPAEILTRPGQLTEVEFGMIKAHPGVGYDIVKGVAFPWPVADMVLQHHERMDGSGYPAGLVGDQIILEARILAVADVVEAVTNPRPYRAPGGIDAALSEIETKRGQCYDAQVVDACLRLFREKGYALSHIEDS